MRHGSMLCTDGTASLQSWGLWIARVLKLVPSRCRCMDWWWMRPHSRARAIPSRRAPRMIPGCGPARRWVGPGAVAGGILSCLSQQCGSQGWSAASLCYTPAIPLAMDAAILRPSSVFPRFAIQVTEGSGRMLVVAVGEHSEWGRTMALVVGEVGDTPLQEKLGWLATAIGKLGFIVAVICFVVLLVRWVVGGSGAMT